MFIGTVVDNTVLDSCGPETHFQYQRDYLASGEVIVAEKWGYFPSAKSPLSFRVQKPNASREEADSSDSSIACSLFYL